MKQMELIERKDKLLLELEKVDEDMVAFGQKWIGKNLQECIPEIAKDFLAISIKRENITFVTYHPRRTKRPKFEVEKNRCRLNTYHITKDTVLCDEFNTKIKSVTLGDCILYNTNNEPYCTNTLHFELDDTEEYILEI